MSNPTIESPYVFECDLPSGHRVCVNANGVAIWDSFDGRLVVDASSIVKTNRFKIGSDIFRRGTGVGSGLTFPARYLRRKPRLVERKSK